MRYTVADFKNLLEEHNFEFRMIDNLQEYEKYSKIEYQLKALIKDNSEFQQLYLEKYNKYFKK